MVQNFYATTGDALYFKANQIHRLENQTADEVQVMIVVTASYL